MTKISLTFSELFPPQKIFTVLAPLAGITNLAFRKLIKKIGCDLVCSEMVSSNGLTQKSSKTYQLLKSTPEEKPISVQLFGNDPEIMAEAAWKVQESGASICDINMGCSIRKIVKNGSGVALMKDPWRVEKIFTAMRKKITIPLTVKIRSGWTPDGENAITIAKIAANCGIDAISIHPRTATQAFRGKADWALISRVKKEISLPIIGNGDIITAKDALKMCSETKCDGIMVGRAAMANPWIFLQIATLLRGETIFLPDIVTHGHILKQYVQNTIELMGETHGCRILRSRLGWFVKGFPHNINFRKEITQLSTAQDAYEKIDAYIDFLTNLSQNN